MGHKKKLTGIGATALLAAVAVLGVIHAQTGAAEGVMPVVSQTVDGLKAEMKVSAYPAKILHHNEFTVTLTDREGAPVQGFKLSANLTMPSMVCGRASFDLKEISPGVYKGDAVPLMAGMWEAAVTADTGSGNLIFSRKLLAEH
jgi:nitrogen fixation protein FixH